MSKKDKHSPKDPLGRNAFEENKEPRLDEVMEKPLDVNIIDQMAADEEERHDMVVFLTGVNPMQINLIKRMLNTLKVEAVAMKAEDVMQQFEEGGSND